MKPAPCILVVDDEAAVRLVAVRALVRAGYWVLDARTGEEAMMLVDQQGNIDLLITDLTLPEMSGLALAVEMESRRPSVKVLYMSGNLHDGPPDSFLPKPFSINELVSMVQNLVGPGFRATRDWSAPESPAIRQRGAS